MTKNARHNAKEAARVVGIFIVKSKQRSYCTGKIVGTVCVWLSEHGEWTQAAAESPGLHSVSHQLYFIVGGSANALLYCKKFLEYTISFFFHILT